MSKISLMMFLFIKFHCIPNDCEAERDLFFSEVDELYILEKRKKKTAEVRGRGDRSRCSREEIAEEALQERPPERALPPSWKKDCIY